jgi:predicted TIM-barrel fold metal-dependent hydrolase
MLTHADYVDPDAHVWETADTWAGLTAAESVYRPEVLSVDAPTGISRIFPVGARTLADPVARVEVLDELGIAVQVLHSTFWSMTEVPELSAEIALARCWNRWMAQRTEGQPARLRWALRAPLRDVAASLRELEFGAAHGAAAVHLRGYEHGRRLSDPVFFPVYQRAAELGLVLSVHVGAQSDTMNRHGAPGTLWDAFAPVAGAFYALLIGDIAAKVPGARWSFAEAGGAWLPWVAALAGRVDETLQRSPDSRWRENTASLLARMNCFISCWSDDDLPALTELFGVDNLTVSSNWGHYSAGSDPAAHALVDARHDLSPEVRHKLLSANGQRLFGLTNPVDTLAIPS